MLIFKIVILVIGIIILSFGIVGISSIRTLRKLDSQRKVRRVRMMSIEEMERTNNVILAFGLLMLVYVISSSTTGYLLSLKYFLKDLW